MIHNESQYERYTLVGSADNVQQVYRQYCASLSIAAVLTDDSLDELPVTHLTKQDILDRSYEGMLLLCDDAVDSPLASLLYFNDFVFEQDYIDIVSFRCQRGDYNHAGKKSLFVAYGNCHIRDVVAALLRHKGFREKYAVRYFPLANLSAAEERQLAITAAHCTVFFYTIERFSTRYRDAEKYIRARNDTCIRIGLPCYDFRGYFPQTNPDVFERNEFDILRDMYSPYQRADMNINQMVHDGIGDQEIADRLHGDLYEESEILLHYQKCLHKLGVMDRLSSIPIAPYVTAEGKAVRMFKDPSHFSDNLIFFLAKSVLEKIDLTDDYQESDKTCIHPFSEVPIYPAVARALRLTFWMPDATYTLRLTDGCIQVTFPQYIVAYTSYCRAVLNVKLQLKTGTVRTDG